MAERISGGRKAAYYIGIGMTVIGLLLFASVFFTFFSGFGVYGGGTRLPFGRVKTSSHSVAWREA
jgi:hypothetical protein